MAEVSPKDLGLTSSSSSQYIYDVLALIRDNQIDTVTLKQLKSYAFSQPHQIHSSSSSSSSSSLSSLDLPDPLAGYVKVLCTRANGNKIAVGGVRRFSGNINMYDTMDYWIYSANSTEPTVHRIDFKINSLTDPVDQITWLSEDYFVVISQGKLTVCSAKTNSDVGPVIRVSSNRCLANFPSTPWFFAAAEGSSGHLAIWKWSENKVPEKPLYFVDDQQLPTTLVIAGLAVNQKTNKHGLLIGCENGDLGLVTFNDDKMDKIICFTVLPDKKFIENIEVFSDNSILVKQSKAFTLLKLSSSWDKMEIVSTFPLKDPIESFFVISQSHLFMTYDFNRQIDIWHTACSQPFAHLKARERSRLGLIGPLSTEQDYRIIDFLANPGLSTESPFVETYLRLQPPSTPEDRIKFYDALYDHQSMLTLDVTGMKFHSEEIQHLKTLLQKNMNIQVIHLGKATLSIKEKAAMTALLKARKKMVQVSQVPQSMYHVSNNTTTNSSSSSSSSSYQTSTSTNNVNFKSH
jgi:hypothetical protein